jgi:transposase
MYASLDLHKVYSQAVVMDTDGVVEREERIENSAENMEKFSDGLPPSTQVVIESSSTWYWVYQILSKKHKVVLANPLKTKAIASAKLKTDKVDALKLANLLRGGYIAESYIPPRRTMELRELVRYRENLVRMRTNVKNRIHGYLLMNNVPIDAKPFSKEFVQGLRKIDDLKVQGHLRLLESIDAEVHEASRVISREAADDDGAKLLMTIPGVSFYSALLIVSEVGDVNRFPDSDSLVAYAGLVPSTHSSGGTTFHGRITKTGSPYLRWILGQCTRINIRNEPDGRLALFYNRLARKKGSQKAIVAATAKMLRIVFWMLRDRQPYHG